jgi:2-oxoglutarate dehydrogenase complex dehydrogenase (E1) component-like enzyme
MTLLLLQVFYELHAERERQGKQEQVALVRVEQLAPFPFDLVCREIYRCVHVYMPFERVHLSLDLP